jgi:hypothetical protein
LRGRGAGHDLVAQRGIGACVAQQPRLVARQEQAKEPLRIRLDAGDRQPGQSRRGSGLVQRERSEEDRRGAYAVLTMEGKAMRRRMWPVYAQGIKELFEDRVTDAQAQMMAEALRGTLDAARMLPEDTPGSTQPAHKQRAGKR